MHALIYFTMLIFNLFLLRIGSLFALCTLFECNLNAHLLYWESILPLKPCKSYRRYRIIANQFYFADFVGRQKRKEPTLGTSGSSASASKMKSALAIDPATKRPREAYEEDVSNAKPPLVLAKEKSLTLVKAQLVVAPEGLAPIQLLNHVSNRAKVRWTLDSGAAMASPQKNDWYLSVDGVLVARLSSDDPDAARLSGCKVALQRLASVCLEVREEAAQDGQPRLVLYTTADKRIGWQSPDDALLRFHEHSLAQLATVLAAKPSALLEDSPEQCLREACAALVCPFMHEARQLAGWKQQLQVSVADVLVHSESLQGLALARGREAENVRKACGEAVELLRRPHRRTRLRRRRRTTATDRRLRTDL